MGSEMCIRDRLVDRGDRTPLKAPRFDGTGDIEVFLMSFGDVAENNRWNDRMRLLQLRSSLEGPATRSGGLLTYDLVCRNLRTRFGFTRASAKSRLQTLQRDQATGAQEHGMLVAQLVSVAYPEWGDNQRDDLGRTVFLESMNYVGLNELMVPINPLTMSDAVNAAESFMQARNRRRYAGDSSTQARNLDDSDTVIESVRQPSPVAATTPEMGRIATALEAICQRLGTLEGRSATATSAERGGTSRTDGKGEPGGLDGPICWTCRQRGHVSRDCPNRQAARTSQNQGNGPRPRK